MKRIFLSVALLVFFAISASAQTAVRLYCQTGSSTGPWAPCNSTTPLSTLGVLSAGTATIGNIGPLPYPVGATPITASSGNVAASAAVATLAAAVGKTTYITGFQITGGGATLGLVVNPTVAGTVSGTLTYSYAAIAGVLLANTPYFVAFNPPIPASATNTAIVVTLPSLGTGNTNATVVATGYQL